MGAMPPLAYSIGVLATGFGLALVGALLTDLRRLLNPKTTLRSIEDAFFRCFSGMAMATAYWSLHSRDPLIVYTINMSVSVLKVRPAMVIEVIGRPLTSTASKVIAELADRIVQEASGRQKGPPRNPDDEDGA